MFSYKDVNKRREWVAHFQAGAGIVADSDLADEQKECENKAAALARANDLAESSLVEKWFKFYPPVESFIYYLLLLLLLLYFSLIAQF